jgi:hypothetical protein
MLASTSGRRLDCVGPEAAIVPFVGWVGCAPVGAATVDTGGEGGDDDVGDEDGGAPGRT